MKLAANFFKSALLCMILMFLGCSDDDGDTNLAPVIADQSFSLAEGSPDGTVVGTVVATDADQDPLTFAIISGNPNNAFAINASSGQLTVNSSTVLDAQTEDTFVMSVEVSDGQQGVTASITVNLVDVGPSIADQSFSIDENSESGTVVGTVVGNDPGQATLTFSITAGNSGDAFTIDPASGQITVNTAAMLDFEVNPSFSLTVEVSNAQESASATITIALNDVDPEPFTTRQQIIDALNSSYVELESYIEFTYLFDAIYANVIQAPSTDWEDVFSHSLVSTDEKVSILWSDAYEIWFVLNNIINSAAAVLPAGQERDEITAQALTIRSYLQLNLINWFESIPLETGIEAGNLAQSQSSEVLNQIKADLNTAIDILPASWTGDDMGNVTRGTAQSLLCRAYLETQEWQQALDLSQDIRDNVLYTLSPATDNFTASDTEIIWGFDQTGEAVFTSAYDRGNHVPLLRLTEIYLINAEANIQTGGSAQGRTVLNELKQRASQTPIADGVNGFSELIELTFEQWVFEMGLGGVSFATLKRFDKALSEFMFEEFRLLVPIPQEAIDENPNLFQNPGY